jgi:shikimate kinase
MGSRKKPMSPARQSPIARRAEWQLCRSAVLIGMPGAGKTAVGRVMARALGVAFRDSDAEIEAAANMSIPEIFARDGEPFFRARETEVLARLLAGPPGIVSTGGGAWMRAENRQLIAAHGTAIWLDVDLDTLWHRVRGRDNRPLLRGPDARARLAALYAERRPVYALAPVRLANDGGGSVAATARAALIALARGSGAALCRREAT